MAVVTSRPHRGWTASTAVPALGKESAMHRKSALLTGVAGVVALGTGVSLLLAIPSSAAPSPRDAAVAGSARAGGAGKLPTATFLPLKLAQKAAEAATVVDAEGVVIAQLRNDGTTTASLDASKGKAYASAGFRTPTDVLAANEPANPGLLQVPGFVILAGGLPISSGGKVIGGIGVGGAPSGAIDKTCAQAGLDSIAGSL